MMPYPAVSEANAVDPAFDIRLQIKGSITMFLGTAADQQASSSRSMNRSGFGGGMPGYSSICRRRVGGRFSVPLYMLLSRSATCSRQPTAVTHCMPAQRMQWEGAAAGEPGRSVWRMLQLPDDTETVPLLMMCIILKCAVSALKSSEEHFYLVLPGFLQPEEARDVGGVPAVAPLAAALGTRHRARQDLDVAAPRPATVREWKPLQQLGPAYQV